jgi:hypothetical protein
MQESPICKKREGLVMWGKGTETEHVINMRELVKSRSKEMSRRIVHGTLDRICENDL